MCSYPDKKQLRSKALEHESMDNQCIKQAVEASYILIYPSNMITVLLGLESFCFELKKTLLITNILRQERLIYLQYLV